MISIGPSVEKNVAMGECSKLLLLGPNERLVIYDRLLNYLKNKDPKLARELQWHWDKHLKNFTYDQIGIT